MRNPKPTVLPRLKVVSSGPVMTGGEIAADLAAAVLGVQAIILQGLIKSGVLDLNQWRSLFQASLDELPLAERHQAHGFCLGQMIGALDAIERGEKPAPKFH
jgi:hypothetical protein